jgi:hypothetical protein
VCVGLQGCAPQCVGGYCVGGYRAGEHTKHVSLFVCLCVCVCVYTHTHARGGLAVESVACAMWQGRDEVTDIVAVHDPHDRYS